MKRLNVAMLALYDMSGRILLNRRNDADEEVWGLIGGGIDEGEQPLRTILREVEEELHYTIDEARDDLAFVKKLAVTTDTVCADVHLFAARFPGFHEFSDSDEVSVEDLQLFPIEEALTLPLLPIAKEILQS